MPHPPGAFFQARLIDNWTKRVPISNEASSESSRRDVSTRRVSWHRHYSNRGDVDHGKSAQGGACDVDTPSYRYTVICRVVVACGNFARNSAALYVRLCGVFDCVSKCGNVLKKEGGVPLCPEM